MRVTFGAMLNRTMSNGAFGTDAGNRTLRRTFGGTFIGVVFHTRRLFPSRVRCITRLYKDYGGYIMITIFL